MVEVPVARPPVPRRLEPEATESIEGVSAEVDRAEAPAEATDAQHVRAKAKYGPSAPAEVTRGPARRRLVLGRVNIRDAVLWAEILGRPKGL